MNLPARLRYKVFTSFAICALAVVAIVRLLTVAPPAGRSAFAYVTLAVLAIAGFFRGIVLLRAGRAATGRSGARS